MNTKANNTKSESEKGENEYETKSLFCPYHRSGPEPGPRCQPAGCSSTQRPTSSSHGVTQLADSGTLYLKVNPEIAVRYDAQGTVTAVEGINDDGKALITDLASYVGLECRNAVRLLVGEINKAGYFVEEVEGETRKIVIEVERGSVIPDEAFLNNVVADVQDYVNTMTLTSNIALEGQTDYGVSNTDYGPDTDGVTDYNASNYSDNSSNYSDNSSNYDGGDSGYDD